MNTPPNQLVFKFKFSISIFLMSSSISNVLLNPRKSLKKHLHFRVLCPMDSVSATKSKRKKLFSCFRTTASAGSFRGKDTQHEQVFPSMAVKAGGGALSRALKAILFGTSLAKKIRKRKVKQKQKSNKENQRHPVPSTTSNISQINSDLHYRKSFGCSSRASTPLSSSSFCNSPNSSDINDIPFRFYPTASNRLFRQINRRKTYSGWFMLLVCLLSLILWGKIRAILCTSIWMLCFCLIRRIIGFRSPDYKAKAAAMRSGEYKKKIVSEGFLNGDRSAARNSILRVD